MTLNLQIFHQIKNQATRQMIQRQQQNGKIHHMPIVKGKEIQTNQVKAIIIPIST
jgi:hypothetical protein